MHEEMLKILREQLELLSERSKNVASIKELCDLTEAMVQVIRFSLCP